MFLVVSYFQYASASTAPRFCEANVETRPVRDEENALKIYKSLVNDLDGTNNASGFVSVDRYDPLAGDITAVKFYNKVA